MLAINQFVRKASKNKNRDYRLRGNDARVRGNDTRVQRHPLVIPSSSPRHPLVIPSQEGTLRTHLLFWCVKGSQLHGDYEEELDQNAEHLRESLPNSL